MPVSSYENTGIRLCGKLVYDGLRLAGFARFDDRFASGNGASTFLSRNSGLSVGENALHKLVNLSCNVVVCDLDGDLLLNVDALSAIHLLLPIRRG